MYFKHSLVLFDLHAHSVSRLNVSPYFNFFQTKGKLYLDSVLVDDKTLIVATENRKIKKINLDSMTVYQTFQGLTPPNEVRLILANHGKGNR